MMRIAPPSLLLSLSLLCSAPLTHAHTVWLETADEPGQFHLRFGGHAGVLEDYAPEKLISAEALLSSGEQIALERTIDAQGVTLLVPDESVLVAVHFDNGIWARDRLGRSVNRPMSAVPGAQSATWAPKYHKTILHWDASVTQPLGQAFEVTPLHASPPVAGQPFTVRITLHGEPVAGVPLGRGEAGTLALSDEAGLADFMPEAGENFLWAGIRLPVSHEEYSELSYEYLLGFEAQP